MCGKYKKCIFPCKSEDEFRILAEECLTFETVTSCLAQRLRSHVLAGLWAVALSCMFSPDFKIAEKMFQEGTIIPFPADSVQSFLRTSGGTPYVFARVGRFCTEFSSDPVSSGVVRILQWARSRHSLLSNDFRYINVLILQGRAPDRCLCRVFGPFVFGYVNNFRPS